MGLHSPEGVPAQNTTGGSVHTIRGVDTRTPYVAMPEPMVVTVGATPYMRRIWIAMGSVVTCSTPGPLLVMELLRITDGSSITRLLPVGFFCQTPTRVGTIP